MKTFPIRSVWLSVLLFFTLDTPAQESKDPLGALQKIDSESVSLLASYPDSIRNAALTAARYPEALVNMQELQEQTKGAFRDITSGLEREDQENIWNISRYPGLPEKLTAGGRKSKSELESIAAAYPQDVRTAITESGRKNYDELKKISGLNKSTEESFSAMIGTYPRPAQDAFRTVVKHPELVDLLAGNLKLTVKAGDLYRQYPQRLDQQLDALGAEVAEKRAREAKDWKEGLDKDPEAKEEYTKASNAYLQEQGGSVSNVTTQIVVVPAPVYVYPYSWWYGYPVWWNYPYWYPYPYGYQVGFYYSPYDYAWYGYPSPYFMHWYFYYYPNHYYYNHFTDYCIDHYYGHHDTPSPANHEIGQWVNTERPRVSDNFFANDGARPERIKELGKAEMETQQYNRKNPDAPVTREEYVSRNESEFPKLAPEIRQTNTAKPAPSGATPGRTVPAPPGSTTPAGTGGTAPQPGGTYPSSRPAPQPQPQSRPDIYTPPAPRPQPQPHHTPAPRPSPSLPAPRPQPAPRPRR